LEIINGYLSRYDKLLILIIVILSMIMIVYPFIDAYFKNDINQRAQIYIQDSSNKITKIKISDTYQPEPIIIEVEGPIGISIIEAHQGRVRLKEAPVKDPAKICEKTGWISKSGPSIICVPNRISIWIENSDSEIDAVSW